MSQNQNKTSLTVFKGSGSPLGKVTAEQGALYIDSLNKDAYVHRGTKTNSSGWVRIGTKNKEVYIVKEEKEKSVTELLLEVIRITENVKNKGKTYER